MVLYPGGGVINYSENKPRKQWNKEPPQTLMNMLSNADVSLAFKTYTIYKPASENILRGPLSDESKASDEVDGEHEAVVVDSERLEPRSDEDDTYVQMMSLHLCFLWFLKEILA